MKCRPKGCPRLESGGEVSAQSGQSNDTQDGTTMRDLALLTMNGCNINNNIISGTDTIVYDTTIN